MTYIAYFLIGLLIGLRVSVLVAWKVRSCGDPNFELTWDEWWYDPGPFLSLVGCLFGWPLLVAFAALQPIIRRSALVAPPADVRKARAAKRKAELEAEYEASDPPQPTPVI